MYAEELGLDARTGLPAGMHIAEYDTYLMAKTFFDLKEYDRCASILEKCESNKSRFLRLYSKYLVGRAWCWLWMQDEKASAIDCC